MSGFYPAPAWPYVFGAWVVVSLAMPFRAFPTPGRVWKFGVIAWIFVPWASPTVVVALILVGLSGVASLVPSLRLLREASLLASMAMVWLVSLLTSNVYAHIEERVQTFPGASALVGGFGKALGGDFAQGPNLGYATPDANIAVLPSLDKFGGEYFAVLLASFIVAGFIARFSRKSVCLLALALCVYAAVRAVWLVDSFGSFDQIVWWNEETLFESFLPGILIATILLARCRKPERTKDQNSRPELLVAWTSFACGAFLLCFSWNFTPPGRAKNGKVLFDESHGGWETSLMPLDTRWYGSRTVYNYRNFREALEHYFDVQVQTKPIDDRSLQGVSVLILKTPSIAYGERERASIRRFVSRGGGVWFIGDHTDAFGMTTYLNETVGDFGYQFRKDAYLEMPVGRNLWSPGAFTPPSAREIPLFLFYTGCSLRSPWLAADTMSGGRQLLDEMDLSKGTFFGDLYGQLKEPVSHTTFSSHMVSGKGRVAVWTDSTLFSNFSFYVPGKLEVAISTVDWLNRENGTFDLRLGLMGLGLGLISCGLLFSRAVDLTLAAALGIALVPLALGLYAKTFYPVKRPHRAFQEIAFYEPNLTPHFPVALPLDEPLAFGYLSAYVATQRVGMRPIIVKGTEELTRGIEVTAYIPGALPLSKAERKELLGWVARGGRLIILDGGRLAPEEMDDFLKAVHATDARLPEEKDELRASLTPPGTRQLVDTTPKEHGAGFDTTALGLRGGKPHLIDRSSRISVASEYPLGRGTVVLTSTVNTFSDLGLGEVKTVPDASQLARFQTLYRWFSGPKKSD